MFNPAATRRGLSLKSISTLWNYLNADEVLSVWSKERVINELKVAATAKYKQ